MKKNILVLSFLIACIACENKNNGDTKEVNKSPQKTDSKSEQISENSKEKQQEKPTETLETNKKVTSENKWYSKDFYGNGITEYIDQVSYTKEGNDTEYFTDFYYYTSANPKKVQLKINKEQTFKEGMEGRTEYEVSFPNQKGVYMLTFKPGYFVCKNPDGKIQEYQFQ